MVPTPTDPLAKLQADVEFWRKNYEEQEAENKRLQGLVDKGARETDGKAIVHLRTLAEHVAGRNGMLQPSRIFCSKCEGAGHCVLQDVYEFLGER